MPLMEKLRNLVCFDKEHQQNEAKGIAVSKEKSLIEDAIAERMQSIDLTRCGKISFSEISALGTAFAQMIPALRTVSTQITVDGMGYIPINNTAGEALKQFRKDMPGIYSGTFKSAETGKSVMAQLKKLDPQTISTSATLPIDPTMLLMAAMLANIEKKLDDIRVVQASILSFLEQDKQAQQQADLRFLSDTLSGYKYNWDCEQFLQNHHVKAMDIKQSADKNVEFYQMRIADEIKKMPVMHLEQAVKNAVSNLGTLFAEYRLAVYIYSFATFLELLLLRNFKREYLDENIRHIKTCNEKYIVQLEQCRNCIEKFSEASLESKVMEGIGNASKALGKMIASTPLLSKGTADEWLQESGAKLLQDNADKNLKIGEMLANDEMDCEVFINCIENIDLVSNGTTDLIFDGAMLYLATT